MAKILWTEESLTLFKPLINSFCSDLADDFVSEFFLITYFIFQELKIFKLLEIFELFNVNSFLDHVFELGHFLEAVDDVHQVVPQVDKLVFEDKPFLIEFVDFPQILPRQEITIGFATVIINVHDLDFFPVKHFQNKSDFFLDLALFSA